MKITDFSHDFIERCIQAARELSERTEEQIRKGDTHIPSSAPKELRKIYFAGKTLFLDISIDRGGEYPEWDSITAVHTDETVGMFSGNGPRVLMSLTAIKDLEATMRNAWIEHEPKKNLDPRHHSLNCKKL